MVSLHTTHQEPPADLHPIVNAFYEQVEQALAKVHQTEWLGNRSPLAAPYLLGSQLSSQHHKPTSSADERGQMLQRVLQDTAATLATQGTNGLYFQRLLEHSFFVPRPRDVILTELGVSKNTYYEHRRQAVRQFAQALLQRLNPALRVELPVPPTPLIGRETEYTRCRVALIEGKTVALTGLSGVGKTTLGAHLAHSLPTHTTFWFTLRPSLNDTLDSLLFSLGYFISQRGATLLWQQMVASHSAIQPEVTMGLLRQDLHVLQQQQRPLLLCFDEIDLLRPTELSNHSQITTFLESLRGMVALLLIGQHLAFPVDLPCTLQGFDLQTTAAYLSQVGKQLAPAELQHLHRTTWGNPRLVELLLASESNDEPLADLLRQMATAPSLRALFNRVWQRLTLDNQQTLAELSVFRRTAPSDAWEEEQLRQLQHYHLLSFDASGGVELLPVFKGIIAHTFSAETHQLLQQAAAQVRLQRGEYTEAAYHLCCGGLEIAAIWLWYIHRVQELNQGQGYAAHELFCTDQVITTTLDERERDLLRLISAELNKLVGAYDQVRTVLADQLQTPLLQILADRLQGDVAEMTGQLERARREYARGLGTVSHLLNERAVFRKNLAWVWLREEQPERAWQESQLARYEVENIQGLIRTRQGDYRAAEAHYTAALHLAQELGHLEGEAKTRDNLAGLLARQNQFAAADQHLKIATEQYQTIGRVNAVADLLVNRAFFLNLAGQPAEARRLAADALVMFQQLGDTFGEAVAAQNLAEACLVLNDIASAWDYACQVVATEESSTLPDGLRVQAEVYLRKQEPTHATRCAHEAVTQARANDDLFLEAYALRTLGLCYLLQHKQPAAVEALGQAVARFQEAHLWHEIELTLAWRLWCQL